MQMYPVYIVQTHIHNFTKWWNVVNLNIVMSIIEHDMNINFHNFKSIRLLNLGVALTFMISIRLFKLRCCIDVYDVKIWFLASVAHMYRRTDSVIMLNSKVYKYTFRPI